MSYGAVFYAVTDFLDLICDRLFRFRERSRDGLFDCIEFFLDVSPYLGQFFLDRIPVFV